MITSGYTKIWDASNSDFQESVIQLLSGEEEFLQNIWIKNLNLCCSWTVLKYLWNIIEIYLKITMWKHTFYIINNLRNSATQSK